MLPTLLYSRKGQNKKFGESHELWRGETSDGQRKHRAFSGQWHYSKWSCNSGCRLFSLSKRLELHAQQWTRTYTLDFIGIDSLIVTNAPHLGKMLALETVRERQIILYYMLNCFLNLKLFFKKKKKSILLGKKRSRKRYQTSHEIYCPVFIDSTI